MIADPDEFRRIQAEIEREQGRQAYAAARDDWKGDMPEGHGTRGRTPGCDCPECDISVWFRVRFPDKGAGATRAHGYVQGNSATHARQVAAEHERFNMYDTEKGDVIPVKGADTAEIREKLLLPANPNDALTADGELIRRSDVREGDR